jgi:predicted nucleotidyltransferase
MDEESPVYKAIDKGAFAVTRDTDERLRERFVALSNEILRGVVGSTAHGTAIDGQDDRDEMGVFIEPPEYVCGLETCDHYIYRDKPEGVRSEAGDLDLTLYSLRKFCRLCAQGNPSIMMLLWLPEHIIKTPLADELIAIRDAFTSRSAGARFLGYLTAQKLKMKGERAHTVNRPELVAKYGYDTKFAMHALRLGYEGIELMTESTLTLPVPEPRLTTLRAVRTGQVTEGDALSLIEDAESRLRGLVDACTREADDAAINAFMVKAHHAHWRKRGV